MQPYTVLILHAAEGAPHVHHVMSRNRRQAYLDAVYQRETEYALSNHVGLGQRLSLEQAVIDWPLLMVLEGHIPLTPVLWLANLFEASPEEEERKAS